MNKKFIDIIKEAEDKKIAIGHFNIANLEGLWGIFNAARNLNVPIAIGLSEGERDYVGIKQAVALVKSLREEFDYPIFINADHTYSVKRCKEAIDAGFDAVIFDGAKLPMEENIAKAKEVVEYAKALNLANARSGNQHEVLVEGELGYIGTSSKVLDEIPEGVSLDQLTTPEEARRFVEETGVDLFAPSVGNIHGMLKKVKNPKLNTERIKELREVAGVPLVLHGGSGISDDNFKDAIANGISTIHINTEIRRAFREGIEKSFIDNPDEIAPYRLMKPGLEAIQRVVEKRLKLFSNL